MLYSTLMLSTQTQDISLSKKCVCPVTYSAQVVFVELLHFTQLQSHATQFYLPGCTVGPGQPLPDPWLTQYWGKP